MRKNIGPLLPDVYHINYPDMFRSKYVKNEKRAIENCLLMIFVGQKSLRIQPPFVITYEQIDKAVDILDAAIDDYVNNRIGDEVFEYAKGR